MGDAGRVLCGPGFGRQLPHRAQAPAGRAEDVFQFARLVQRRHRDRATVFSLFHQQCRRHHGVHPGPGQDRGHAVQVRLWYRHKSVPHSLVEGTTPRRRHGVGPGQFYEGLRCLRGRDQVGRQDATSGQDGDPQHRSPRHRGVHSLQGQGRKEGLDAHRRGLRRLVRRRGLQVCLLPKLQQLGTRD